MRWNDPGTLEKQTLLDRWLPEAEVGGCREGVKEGKRHKLLVIK